VIFLLLGDRDVLKYKDSLGINSSGLVFICTNRRHSADVLKLVELTINTLNCIFVDISLGNQII